MPKIAKKIVLDGEEVNIPVGGGSTEECMSVPPGVIWPWYHTEEQTVPDGWALCDGENGTPDLRGRFLLGASDDHIMGETGGEEEVTLTVEQMPKHTHSYILHSSPVKVQANSAANISPYNGQVNAQTGENGGSESHQNMPPYFVIDYIMKL